MFLVCAPTHQNVRASPQCPMFMGDPTGCQNFPLSFKLYFTNFLELSDSNKVSSSTSLVEARTVPQLSEVVAAPFRWSLTIGSKISPAVTDSSTCTDFFISFGGRQQDACVCVFNLCVFSVCFQSVPVSILLHSGSLAISCLMNSVNPPLFSRLHKLTQSVYRPDL